MADYILALPPQTKNIQPRINTFTREGKDGNEIIVPIFGGDRFVGEALDGKWTKENDGVITSPFQDVESGALNLSGYSHSAGTWDECWIWSKSQLLMCDGCKVDVHLKIPSHSSAQGFYISFALRPLTDDTTVPVNQNDVFYVYLLTDTTTYTLYVKKTVAGTATTLVNGIEVSQEGTMRFKFSEQKDGHTHIYWHDGTGNINETNDEVDSSPFELDLPFDVAYPIFVYGTSEATNRTVTSNGITVDYPFNADLRKLIKFDVPRGEKTGSTSVFVEAEDGQMDVSVTTTDLDDDSGESMVLNAQYETGYMSMNYQGVTLGKGRYLFQARIKDTNQVANDVQLFVYNNTDARYLNIEGAWITITVTGQYKIYEVLCDITDDDLGDSLFFGVSKLLATANTIYVDWYNLLLYDGLGGRCRCFDDMNQASEDDWKEVYSADHIFVGDCIVQNGFVRLVFEEGTQYNTPEIYYWIHNGWVLATSLLGYVYGEPEYVDYVYDVQLTEFSPEKIRVDFKLVDTAVNDDNIRINIHAILRRGEYGVEFVPKNVYPIGDISLYAHAEGTRRRWGYATRVIDAGIQDHDLSLIVANATLWDNLAVIFDDDTYPHLIICYSNLMPTDYYLAAGEIYHRHITINQIASGYSFFIAVVPFSRVMSLFEEAESCTLGGGADTEDLGDDSGSSARLNAQNEYVYYAPGGDALPAGRYCALARIKDTDQVAGDMRIKVEENVGWTLLQEDSTEDIVVTGDFAYYAKFFTVPEGFGASVAISVRKVTATANTIYVDYFLIVPLGNGECWTQDLAHNMTKQSKAEKMLVNMQLKV